jgi:ketosteroid isomerase-like protein
MAIGETAFEERIEAVSEVLVSGDAERLGDLYTRDAELLPPDDDFVTGAPAVVAYWQGVVEAGIESVDIEARDVERHDEMAMRTGEARMKDTAGEETTHVKFIEVWKLEDGTWRIHRDVWNAMGEE